MRYLFYLIDFLYLFRLKHALIEINFKGLINQIVGLISWKKGSEKDLSIDSSDRDRIVKDKSVGLFLNLFDILFGNLDKSGIKENVVRVETRMETYSLVCDINSAWKKNFIA